MVEGFGLGGVLSSLFGGEEDLEGKPIVRFIIFFAQRRLVSKLPAFFCSLSLSI